MNWSRFRVLKKMAIASLGIAMLLPAFATTAGAGTTPVATEIANGLDGNAGLGPIVQAGGVLWVGERYSTSVIPVIGTPLAPISVCSHIGAMPGQPYGVYALAVAGNIIWAECGSEVTAISALTGTYAFNGSQSDSTFPLNTTGQTTSYTYGLAVKGDILWASVAAEDKIIAINATTGHYYFNNSESDSTFALTGYVASLTVAGNILWANERIGNSGYVTALSATTGQWAFGGTEAASAFLVSTADGVPYGGAVAGNVLWVCDRAVDKIVGFNATTGAYLHGTLDASSVIVDIYTYQVNRLTAQGNVIWVTSGSTVTAFNGLTGEVALGMSSVVTIPTSNAHGITADAHNIYVAGDNGSITRIQYTAPMTTPVKVATVYFQVNSAALQASAKSTLLHIAQRYPTGVNLEVDGYMQKNLPGAKYVDISLTRARAVASFLVNHGVTASITVVDKKYPRRGGNLSSARRVELFSTPA